MLRGTQLLSRSGVATDLDVPMEEVFARFGVLGRTSPVPDGVDDVVRGWVGDLLLCVSGDAGGVATTSSFQILLFERNGQQVLLKCLRERRQRSGPHRL